MVVFIPAIIASLTSSGSHKPDPTTELGNLAVPAEKQPASVNTVSISASCGETGLTIPKKKLPALVVSALLFVIAKSFRKLHRCSGVRR